MKTNTCSRFLPILPMMALLIGLVCIAMPGQAEAAGTGDSITITYCPNGADMNLTWGSSSKSVVQDLNPSPVSHRYTGQFRIPRYIESPMVVTPGARGKDADGKSLGDLRFCLVRHDCASTGYWSLKQYEPGKIQNDGVDADGNKIVRCVNGNTVFKSPKDFREKLGLKQGVREIKLYALWYYDTFNIHFTDNEGHGFLQSWAQNTPQQLPDSIGTSQSVQSWASDPNGSRNTIPANETRIFTSSVAEVETSEDYTAGASSPFSTVIWVDKKYVEYVQKKQKEKFFLQDKGITAQGGVAFEHAGTTYYCQLFVPPYAYANHAEEWLKDNKGYKACLAVYNTKTNKTYYSDITACLGHGNSIDYDDASQRLVVSTIAPDQESKDKNLLTRFPAFRELKLNFNDSSGAVSASVVGKPENYPKASNTYRFGKACNVTLPNSKTNKETYAIYDRGKNTGTWVEYRWKDGRYQENRTFNLKIGNSDVAKYNKKGLCAENLNHGFTGTLISMTTQGASIGSTGSSATLYLVGAGQAREISNGKGNKTAAHGNAIVAAFNLETGNLSYTRAISGGEYGIREIESVSRIPGNPSRYYLFSAYHQGTVASDSNKQENANVHVLPCKNFVAAGTFYASKKGK